MKLRLILTIVGVVLIGGATAVAVFIMHGPEQPRAEHRIKAWASTAEQGDTSRMRDLMEPHAFLFATWHEHWAGMRTTLRMQPGHAVCGMTQQGDTTVATVHVRTTAGALCVPVQVDGNGHLALAGTQYRCAFPSSGVQP